MPISTALPSPEIEWESELYGLTVVNNPASIAGTGISNTMARHAMRPALSAHHLLDAGAGQAYTPNGWGARGGSLAVTLQQHFGRPCFRALNPAADNQGEGMAMPASPVFCGPAASLSPGAMHQPSAVVLVWNFHVALQFFAGAAPLWPNDKCGFFFLPFGNGGAGYDVDTSTPTGAAPIGGFGVFLNTVAGVGTWEYVAWANTTGAILERVTVPAASVPAVTDWNTFRFIIQSARSDREATLTVQANGRDVLTARQFGSAFLQRPNTAGGATFGGGWVANIALRGDGVNSDTLFYNFDAKCGRFTPDGAEQQGQ